MANGAGLDAGGLDAGGLDAGGLDAGGLDAGRFDAGRFANREPCAMVRADTIERRVGWRAAQGCTGSLSRTRAGRAGRAK